MTAAQIRQSQMTLIPAEARPAWEVLARALDGVRTACASNPDDWFAKDTEPAIEACGYCPARVQCLAFAVAADERSGVWGGRAFALPKGGKS